MKPTLVILAAGIGRRYGGLKQLEPVGPGGATIMDYSVYDALRAGFGRIVFVIRPEIEAAFGATLGRRFEKHVSVACALQDLSALPAGFDLPSGRTKPWGTGQAVLAAESVVDEPFAVVNADDFYGADSFAVLSGFLQREQGDVPTYAMVGYALRDTLSDVGCVSRAVCRCTSDGWLQSIAEIAGIEKCGPDGRCTDDAGRSQILSGDGLVSMNMWGFTPAVFDALRSAFRGFLQNHGGSNEAEFYLPSVIQDLIRTGRAGVRVLPSKDAWCGVTHPRDKTRVVAMIHELVARGVYPRALWD